MSESPEDFRSPKTSAKITTVKSEIGRVSRFSVNPDWYVGVNRKISVFEWIMIVTAPIVNPIIGVFLIAFAIKHLIQKKRGESKPALRSKAFVLGLAQWAYRLTISFGTLFTVLFLMYKGDRFPNPSKQEDNTTHPITSINST